MESHALLRINAHEDSFLPVEVKVGWLTSQASMRSRASAMVGSRLSQLDDAIRVRALLSIIRSAAPPPTTTTPTAAETSDPPPSAGASAGAVQNLKTGKKKVVCTKQPAQSSSSSSSSSSKEGQEEGAVAQHLCSSASRGHVRSDSATETPPAPVDLELFTRMAVAKMKAVLFQLVSKAEKKERQGKDVFDLYEGLVTSEALEEAAEAGFPALDVDTIMLPMHFRYRTLVAARHRYLLRKLGVLLDLEDGVEALLDLAADTETLRDSLADVDLSSADVEGGEGDDEEEEEEEEEEDEEREAPTSRKESLSLSASASASSVLMSPSSAAASGVASGAVNKATAIPTLRNTSWDKDDKDMGNDDTTEGETETDEESANGTPQAVHRRTIEAVAAPPSH